MIMGTCEGKYVCLLADYWLVSRDVLTSAYEQERSKLSRLVTTRLLIGAHLHSQSLARSLVERKGRRTKSGIQSIPDRLHGNFDLLMYMSYGEEPVTLFRMTHRLH